MTINLNSRGSDCEWLYPWFPSDIAECGCLTTLCHSQALPQTIFSTFHYSIFFYILLVKMPDIPLNLGHNMYKNRLLSVFPRAFSVHEILSSYQHVLIIRMLHFLIIKLIPWQFNTRVTPVFSYLISIPDNALSSIWSPVQHSCVLFHFVAHWV